MLSGMHNVPMSQLVRTAVSRKIQLLLAGLPPKEVL
jgi:hypothetical protein